MNFRLPSGRVFAISPAAYLVWKWECALMPPPLMVASVVPTPKVQAAPSPDTMAEIRRFWEIMGPPDGPPTHGFLDGLYGPGWTP